MNTGFKNETGNRFNKLLVIKRAPNKLIQGHNKKLEAVAAFECLCDCGNTIVTSGHSLRRGDTQSCGCLREDNRFKLPFGRQGRNQIRRGYERDAKKRGLKFLITDVLFDSLLKGLCHYCGAEPTNTVSSEHRRMNGSFVYNGIDRKDNASDYTEENCVSCCKHCNRAKRAMSYDDFISWLTRASSWISKGKQHAGSTNTNTASRCCR